MSAKGVFPVGERPTRQPSLQPEAIGAAIEATKWQPTTVLLLSATVPSANLRIQERSVSVSIQTGGLVSFILLTHNRKGSPTQDNEVFQRKLHNGFSDSTDKL